MAGIITRIDQNQFLYQLHLAKGKLLKLFESDGITWIESDIRLAAFNGVLQTSIKCENAEDSIKRMVEYLKGRNIPFSWQIWEFSSPENLPELLKKFGPDKISSSAAMAIELADKNLVEEKSENFEIIEVHEEKHKNEWLEVAFESFSLSKIAQEAYSSILREQSFMYPAVHLLGQYHGKPVATAVIFYEAGTAGLYWISTLNEYRGKGFGSQITKYALKMIKAHGLEEAILHSSKMGHSVYSKIGFKELKQNIRFHWESCL